MDFKFLSRADEATIRKLDDGLANKWNFSWLDQIVVGHLKTKITAPKVDQGLKKNVEKVTDKISMRVGDSIKKINIKGKAYCEWCSSVLLYGGRGKHALNDHLKFNKGHIKRAIERRDNYTLGSNGTTTARSISAATTGNTTKTQKLFPLFKKHPAVSSEETMQAEPNQIDSVPKQTIPLSDRVATMEAMILGVMAEHSLPMTVAPVLVDLARACSRDPQALSKVQLGRSSTAYKLQFGLSKTLLEELLLDLRCTPFSLNVDEATSSNNKKVLAVLVSYFSNKHQQVVIHHLASVELQSVNSAAVYNAICAIIEGNNIPWINLVSVLFDSCAVMRGHTSGVEVRLRTEKAPHLLDINGDSCHHMQIIARKFLGIFDQKLEKFFIDVFTDFKWCTEYKSYLQEICSLLGIKYTVPQTYSWTRWISAYDRAIESIRMFDAFVLFYFSFLLKNDKRIYETTVKDILKSRNIVFAPRKRLAEINSILGKKSMTKDGSARKIRILSRIFFSVKETKLLLELYASVLFIFKKYVCFFQTKEPMVHKLYDLQHEAVKEFMTCFVRPEKLASGVAKLDLADTANHLPLKQIFIGKPFVHAPTEFRESVLKAFIAAGEVMLKKLPLRNDTLCALSALDPSVIQHTVVMLNLNILGGKASHLMSEDEKLMFSQEVRKYTNESNFQTQLDRKGRVDMWWGSEFITQNYSNAQCNSNCQV